LLNRVSGLPEKKLIQIVSTIANNHQSFADPAEFKTILKLALKHLPEEDLKNPQIDPALRNICTELLFSQQYETATILINCLPLPEWLPNTNTDQYAARMIKEFVRNNSNSADVIKFCQFLSTSGRNERALYVAIEGSLKYGKDKLAVELLTTLNTAEPLRSHYFWPLFIQLSRLHREAGILQVLKLMKQLNVEVDFDTVNQYLLPKLSITLKDTKRSIKVLEDHGIKMSQLITPLTSHLLYQRRIADVFAVNESYPTKVNGEMLIWPLIVLTTVNMSQHNFQNIAKLIKMFNGKSLTNNYDLGGHLLIELASNQKMIGKTESIQQILGEFQLVGVQVSSGNEKFIVALFV
jgi:leucine-rich PPR motif-containing protein, mitochondrial